MLKPLIALVGAAATIAAGLTLAPIASADPACPNLDDQSAVQAAGQSYQQQYEAGSSQAAIDWANFLAQCSQQRPATGVPVGDPYQPQLPAPENSAQLGMDAINETGNPGAGVNCSEYADKYDAMPDGVSNAMDAAEVVGPATRTDVPAASPSDVLMACGLANSVIAGVDVATGDLPGAADAAQQATIGQCWAGQHLIPFVTIPGNCG